MKTVLLARQVTRVNRANKALQDEWACAARRVLPVSPVKMAEMVPRVQSV